MSGDLEAVKFIVRAYPWSVDRRSMKRNRTALEEAEHYGQSNVKDFLEGFAAEWATRESNTVDDFV